MSFLARPRQILIGLVCILLVCAAPSAHASNPLQFNGLTRTISLGSISLIQPYGIAVDPSGNLYIADQGNNRVVEVNPQGVASVLTINGLNTPLSTPRAVAIDGSGNLYIADSGNNRVVEVTPAGYYYGLNMGALSLNNPLAVAVDNSGNLFIADTGNNRIVEVPPSGGAATVLSITGLSSPSTLSFPDGLAVDTSGNLYIADFNNNRIVKVAAGGTTGTVLVSGSSYSYQPVGVAVDAIGNVYFSGVSDGGYISQVDTSGNPGIMNFSPTSPTGSTPKGIAVDVFGAVYVTDSFNSRILVVNPQMNPNITYGSSGYSVNKTAVGFGHITLGSATPTSLTLQFHIASTALGSVGVVTNGTTSLDFSLVSGGTTCVATTVSTSCNVVVSFLPTAPGLRNGAVVLYDGSQNVLMSVPLYGFADSPVAALAPNTGTVINTDPQVLSNPFQVALDGAGNMYVGNYSSKNVTKTTGGGGSGSTTLVSLGTPGGTAVQNITGAAVDGAGNLFIGDHQNSRILVVTPGGVVSVLTINGLSPVLGFPVALAFDGGGNLYIGDFTNGRVVEVSSLVVAGSTSSGYGTVISTGTYTFGGSTLTGIAVDLQRTLYIAARTQNNSSIIKVTAAGAASKLTIPSNITPAINNPQGVGVDAMGNVYIVDTTNSRIVELTTAGVASALSIKVQTAPTGLGNTMFGVTVDASGNLYVSDWTNNRIVYVNVSSAALASFASTNVGSTSTDSPKTATVTNLGNQALTTTPAPIYTADFTVNSGDTNLCTSSTSLLAGTACDVSVKFTPQSVGLLSENITVTDNTLNVASSTQNVAVTGTGLQPGDTTSTTVAVVPTALVVGQPATTITATIADTQSGHTSTVPTGTVSTFTDTLGGTVTNLITSAATLSSGKVILSSVLLTGVGTHTITANYAGVTGSYLTSNGSTTVAVGKASVTVAGPTTQPVTVVVNQLGAIPVTVTGQYAGTGIPLPTGTISYTIVNSSSTTVASGSPTLTAGTGNAIANIPVASTLAAGTYTVTVTYSGDANFAIPSSSTVITLQVGQIQPVIVWSQPSAIAYGITLSGVLNAVAQNQTSGPAFRQANALPQTPPLTVAGTYVYTATPTGGTAATVTSATVLGAGSYTLNVSFTPTDTTTYKSATGSVTLTVNKATPGITLTSNSNPVLVQNSITLTATVSSTISTPTGTVSFVDGSTPIGTGTVNSSGVATYSTAALAVGTHTITAVYSGDTNFLTITSGALTQGVQDFNLVISASGGTTGATSVTALPGGVAVFTFTLSPVGTTTFPTTVTLSASGLPAGATYVFSPATLAAGTGSTTVTLTIQLAQSVALKAQPFKRNGAGPEVLARNKPAPRHASGLPYLALAMLLLPFAGRMRRAGKKLGRLLPLLLLLIAGLAATAGLSGCSALNSGYFGQAPTTYTITVTGTSGTLVHSTSVTLTVQ